MRGLDRRRSLALVAILLGLTAGCGAGGGSSSTGAGGSDEDSVTLMNFGEDYRVYSITKKHPPRKVEDLQAIEAVASASISKIRDGDLIVQWGSTLPDLKEEPGQSSAPEILAYGKEVPEQGGYVLHLDRTVTKMTPEEFKAAPKASGK